MPASAYFSFYPLSALRATSPTRRTRPFCRNRDISPVSAGEFTPKEEAKLHVILSMSSEQTCLQGFVSKDIHKAQAFCKNAKYWLFVGNFTGR